MGKSIHPWDGHPLCRPESFGLTRSHASCSSTQSPYFSVCPAHGVLSFLAPHWAPVVFICSTCPLCPLHPGLQDQLRSIQPKGSSARPHMASRDWLSSSARGRCSHAKQWRLMSQWPLLSELRPGLYPLQLDQHNILPASVGPACPASAVCQIQSWRRYYQGLGGEYQRLSPPVPLPCHGRVNRDLDLLTRHHPVSS